jgi:hypothetical protein
MFPGVSQSDLQRLLDTLRDRGVIEAIKEYREIANVGLAEAKKAVDAIRGKSVSPMTTEALRSYTSASVEHPTLPPPLPWVPDTDGGIHAALYRGHMEEAVRLYRQRHGTGPSEAKAALEAMLRRARGVAANAPAPGILSVMGRILCFVIGAGLLVLSALQAMGASRVRDAELAWGISIVLFAVGSFFMVHSLRRRS